MTWCTLIYGHAQSQAPGLALDAFAGMVRSGVFPTTSAMSSVIVACAKMEDFFLRMKMEDVGVGALNSVISGLSYLGRGDKGFRQFLEMRRHGADKQTCSPFPACRRL